MDYPTFDQETGNPPLPAAAKVGLIWNPLATRLLTMKIVAWLTQAGSSLLEPLSAAPLLSASVGVAA